jgi:hypothetical protein
MNWYLANGVDCVDALGSFLGSAPKLLWVLVMMVVVAGPAA